MEIIFMKKIQLVSILIILLILAFGLNACQILGSECPEIDPNSTHTFWAINIGAGLINNDSYCEIGTLDPYEGEYVNVYMETPHHDDTLAKKVADEFDAMYPNMLQHFGEPVLSDSNSYNGNDEKVTILLMNIIDGYNPIFNPMYVGGYFFSVDYLTEESLHEEYPNDQTNEQAILYVDVDPQDPTTDDVLSTVAHEFQHMINFSQNVLRGGTQDATINSILEGDVPTWIDEGFAMAAEHIWATEVKGYTTDPVNEWPVYSRIPYFNSSSNFVEGNPLVKWISDESGYDVLSNYSTSFLFYQYVRIHSSEDSDIYGLMMNQDYSNNGITLIESAIIPTISTADSFDDLLKDWLIANVINDGTNEYGYGGEAGFTNIRAVIGSEAKTWEFYPGSFMYRKDVSSFTPPSGIESFNFDNTGQEDPSGEYLLIYNPDTNPDGTTVSVSVPSGTVVSDVSAKGYDLSSPQMVDWLITKPLSAYSDKEAKQFILPEHD
jgi:hypothetical protein